MAPLSAQQGMVHACVDLTVEAAPLQLQGPSGAGVHGPHEAAGAAPWPGQQGHSDQNPPATASIDTANISASTTDGESTCNLTPRPAGSRAFHQQRLCWNAPFVGIRSRFALPLSAWPAAMQRRGNDTIRTSPALPMVLVVTAEQTASQEARQHRSVWLLGHGEHATQALLVVRRKAGLGSFRWKRGYD